jgi:intracellular multiplication protein IcmP
MTSGNAPRPEAEPTWTMFLLLIMLSLFCWAVWYFLKPQFLEFLRYLRLFELWVIGLFTDRTAACYAWLRQAPRGEIVPTVGNAELARNCFGAGYVDSLPSDQAQNYFNLSASSIGAIGHLTARYIRIPVAIACVGVAVYAIFFSPRNKFKTRHTLESFIKVQAKVWSVIAPIVDFKPADHSARIPGQMVPDQLPLFAEALSPEEWIAWHRIPVTNGIPDREATRRAFIQQLGPRWQGIEGQPPYIRALFATFALKGTQKREESDDLLGQISTCWTLEGGFKMPVDLAGKIERIVHDQATGGEAARMAAQYAYRTTAMLGTLKWARSMGGVLASAQFLWLRAVDRGLWYPFNNLGRRSFHVEGSGAIAHFMAEESAKKPLLIPRVDTAIVALNQFLAEPEKRPMPIPQREEPQAKG